MSGRNPESARARALAVIAVLAGVVGLLGSLRAPDTETPPRFYLRSAGGAVVFEHERHADRADGCGECHHETIRVQGVAACTDCHEDMDPEGLSHADWAAIEAHSCLGCHQGSEEAPRACGVCHGAVAGEGPPTLGCAECHDDGMDPSLLDHDEMQQVEGHSCEGCHRARGRGEAFHESCQRCHLRSAAEQFVGEDGKARCVACHLD